MLNFLTPKQRERIYLSLLGNLSSYELQASGFGINEEYVRVSFNPAYSDHRVVSLHSLPELSYFAPDWNSDHKVYRGADWFEGAEKDPNDKYHLEHKKMIIEFCLVMIDDVEKEKRKLIREYKKQEKRLSLLRVPKDSLQKFVATPKLNYDIQI